MTKTSYWAGEGFVIQSLGAHRYRQWRRRGPWIEYMAYTDPEPPYHFPTTRLYCLLRVGSY